VPVILLLAALAILGCVVLAALGMAGEMATFPSDSAPLRMDEVTATDVALLRPPLALWGYNVPATEEALGVIARAVTARDTEIATLRQELADMRARSGFRTPGPQPHDEVPTWPAAAEHGEVPAWPAAPEHGEVPDWPAAPEHDEIPAWPAAPEPGPGE
jgi:hypothetical protein